MTDQIQDIKPFPKTKDDPLGLGVDPYERNWMRLSALILLGFFGVVILSGFVLGLQVNGADGRVDPRTVAETAPWNEPGLRQISEGVYEVHVLASAWRFEPREIEVPVGSKVTIYVTSTDLQHGFKITDTNVNMMVVPGQVSKIEYTFDRVGVFPYICHEYCGTGHAGMWGQVIVTGEGTDSAALPSASETGTE